MKKLYYLFILSFLLISCEGEDPIPTPPSKYTLTTQVNPAEGGSVFPSSGEYNEGDQVSVQATPNQYYEFVNWTGNGNGSNSNPLVVTINSNITLVAEFKIIDSDEDGVSDELDNCPDTPSGSTVDENGCAISQLDSDNDGISDDLDQCPDTPDNTSVSSDGCPLIYLAENGITLKATDLALDSVGKLVLYKGEEYRIADDNFINDGDFLCFDISKVITTFITDMTFIFDGWDCYNSEFQEIPDISSWDVSNVTYMSYMFSFTGNFNYDLSYWDVSNVTDMEGMFESSSFNGNISGWDVGNVIDMKDMFYNAKSFNQDISEWNVSNVTMMNWMFYEATNFNQDISNWDVSNVVDMGGMFLGATNFNQDLSGWNVTNVINCTNFNKLADNWDKSIPDFSNCNICPSSLEGEILVDHRSEPNSSIGWMQFDLDDVSLTLSKSGAENIYVIEEDAAWGGWLYLYNQASVGPKIKDDCGVLSMFGDNQYGDNHFLFPGTVSVSNDGKVLFFQWGNTYGEGGYVEARYKDGRLWPNLTN